MIEPTVGRVVWYYDHPQQEQPYAATIAFVWNNTMVNLSIVDASGNQQSRHSVFLYQGSGEKPTHAYCEWMPYQIGQAKKENNHV